MSNFTTVYGKTPITSYDVYGPVEEAYFGKTKNLLDVEKLVDGIIKQLKVPFKKVGKRIIDCTKINKSKENKKIEALLCKEFGFKEMVLHWDGSEIVNAWTVTHGIIKIVEGSEPVLPLKNGDGTYYDSKHKYLCVVNFYAGFVDAGITAEEVVACILHEIGHNFVCTPIVNVVSMLEWAMIPINILKLGQAHAAADSAVAAAGMWEMLRTMFRPFRYLSMISDGINRLFQKFWPEAIKQQLKEVDLWIQDHKSYILAEWEEYVKEVEKAKEEYKKNPTMMAIGYAFGVGLEFGSLIFWHDLVVLQQMLSLQSGYSNEVFADSFATAYGYGSATVALQRRIEYYILDNPYLAKENKDNVYNQYIIIMGQIMTTFLDEHPASQTRMKNQINKLRRELEDPNVDPRVRKELIKDLDRAEKIYDDYLNKVPDKFKHLAVIMNYNHLNEKYFGGKFDIREPINRVLNFGMAEA